MKDYSRQLANPLWQKRRLEIMQRDDFTCQHCGHKDKELHVHHKYYESHLQAHEYPDECLVTLCYECHQEEENLLKERSSVVASLMRRSGFTAFHFWLFFSALDKIKTSEDAYNYFETLSMIIVMDKATNGEYTNDIWRDFDVYVKSMNNKENIK